MASYHSCLHCFKTSFYTQAEFLTGYAARGHFVYSDIFLENTLGEEKVWNSCEKGTQLRKGKLKQSELKLKTNAFLKKENSQGKKNALIRFCFHFIFPHDLIYGEISH